MNLDPFYIDKNGMSIIQPCLEIVAFTHTDLTTGADGYTSLYEAFRKRFGETLTFYQTNTMRGMKKADSVALDMPSFWFSDAKAKKTKLLGFYAHAGEKADGVIPPGLGMFLSKPAKNGYFRILLKLDLTPELPSLVQEILGSFPLVSGYAGLSFAWQHLDHDVVSQSHKLMKTWLMRYPGFSYGDPMQFMDEGAEGVVDVNWLTLLGPDLTAKAGGMEALETKAAAQKGLSLHPLGEGCIIQAGEAPQVGDVNRQEDLPSYKAVGEIVADLRVDDDTLDGIDIEPLDDEQQEEWLGRFFSD